MLSTNRKNVLYTLVGLYFFLASIVMIKEAVTLFSETFAETILFLIHDTTTGVFGGWIATALLQSSGAFDSIIVAFASAGVLPISVSVAAIIGAEVGTTTTTQFVSILGYIRRKGGEFGSTFTVSMMHFWYNVLTLIIFYLLEVFTGALTQLAKLGSSVFSMIGGLHAIPSLLDAITPWIPPLLHVIPPWIGLVAGVVLLIASLMSAEKNMTATFSMPKSWNLIRATFQNPVRSFLAGFVFAVFVPSTSVMVSLLVPLVASGVIKTEYYLFPYIVGANIGTVFDVLMAALATGDPVAMGVWLIHLVTNLVGAAIFLPLMKPFGMFVGRISGYLTEKRLRAVVFVIMVFAVPLLVIGISLLF